MSRSVSQIFARPNGHFGTFALTSYESGPGSPPGPGKQARTPHLQGSVLTPITNIHAVSVYAALRVRVFVFVFSHSTM
jgi:hypothetical protein